MYLICVFNLLKTGSEDYRYTGKQEDTTGLYYFGARYYNPVLGRFTARDTVFGDLTDPQSQNRYVYCRNNPVKFTDPDGKEPALAAGLVIGAVSGMGIRTVSYLGYCIATGNKPTAEGVLIASVTGAISGATSVGSAYLTATLGPGAGMMASGLGNTLEYLAETTILGEDITTKDLATSYVIGASTSGIGNIYDMFEINISPMMVKKGGEFVAENIMPGVMVEGTIDSIVSAMFDEELRVRNEYLRTEKYEAYYTNYSNKWEVYESNRY